MGEPRGISLRTEKRTPEQARRQLEEQLLKQGGVSFNVEQTDLDTLAASGVESTDVSPSRITILLQPETNIVGTDFNVQNGGKKARNAERRGELMNSEFPTGRLVVAQSTDALFSGQNYAMDLSDAPSSLQTAIDQAWGNLQRDSAAYKGDLPPELIARKKMLEPIMRLRLPDVPEPVVAGDNVEDFPVGSRVPYNPEQMNRVPASDQVIFAAYRDKGWKNLGKRQREHYRELKTGLEDTRAADAAK